MKTSTKIRKVLFLASLTLLISYYTSIFLLGGDTAITKPFATSETIFTSADQIIDIHFVDPEDDVKMRNLTSGEILQENITYPDFDITNVTVSTGPVNYTITLYIKGNFNLSDVDEHRYNVKLFWEWRYMDPFDVVASFAHGYDHYRAPDFRIEDIMLGNKNKPSAGNFNNDTHAFTCEFNRSWIANQDWWGVPIDTFFVDAQVEFQYWVGMDYAIMFFDDLSNGYYETQSSDLVPEANFTANQTTIDEGETVQFIYTGTDGDGITSYQWDFGDGGGNSTSRDPTHAFTSAGTYPVTITVVDSDGDSDTEQKLAYITVNQAEDDTNQVPGYPILMVFVFSTLGMIVSIQKTLNGKTVMVNHD